MGIGTILNLVTTGSAIANNGLILLGNALNIGAMIAWLTGAH